ncbi:MAG: histidine kinase [Acidimicrobiales bacterium]
MSVIRTVQRDLHAHRRDYALAGAMVCVAVVALATRIDVDDVDAPQFGPDRWWMWVATILVCASLVGRRRWPLRTFGAGLVLVLPLEFARQRDTVSFFALVIALYSVAAYLPLRLATRGLAMTATMYAVLGASGVIVLSAVPVLGPLLLGSAFALGLIIQRSSARQQRDAQVAIDNAVATIETAELDAADERLRLAQELHDVVAHSLSVIAVQVVLGPTSSTADQRRQPGRWTPSAPPATRRTTNSPAWSTSCATEVPATRPRRRAWRRSQHWSSNSARPTCPSRSSPTEI